MKRFTLLILLLSAFSLTGVAQMVITYDYDAAGNRTTRASSIEVTVVNDSATGDVNIVEPDFYQEFIQNNSLTCAVWTLNSDSDDVLDKETFMRNSLMDDHRFIIPLLESQMTIAQEVGLRVGLKSKFRILMPTSLQL